MPVSPMGTSPVRQGHVRRAEEGGLGANEEVFGGERAAKK